jgi:aspartyl/asparaginyl beta-hydroxylase (cupin superfamily)
MAVIKKWFSFTENEDFIGPEPPFFDISNQPWKRLLEDSCPVIVNELKLIVDERNINIVPYFNATLASRPESWTVFPLIFWGIPYPENCEKAKETLKIVNQISGVTSCGYSKLKANSRIKPHY